MYQKFLCCCYIVVECVAESFETNSVDNAYTLCYGSSAEWFRYCDSALQFVHGLVHCRQIELHGDSYLKLADG